jgi:hypothetical protein
MSILGGANLCLMPPLQNKHKALLLVLGGVVLFCLQLYLINVGVRYDAEPITDWVYLLSEQAPEKPRRVGVAEVAALLDTQGLVPSEKRLVVALAFRDVGVERWPHAALTIPYLHRCVLATSSSSSCTYIGLCIVCDLWWGRDKS